ncbi:MAG: T9SS type A sorting domain-containing protein, partial [Bacteroidia bacterium]
GDPDARKTQDELAEELGVTRMTLYRWRTQNPTYNALLNANTSKVVSIKYQTSWPGVDPMNAQDPTDVATRVSYYGITGVPDSPLDGIDQNDASGSGYYIGAPHNWTQTKIDSAYAVPSPFTINISHTFSSDYDSIFVTCVITASEAYTSVGALKARIAMVEETIHFASAPGTNGETDFYNVCRKMYPSAAGTTLPSTWTLGQTQTITFGAPIPSYIYSKSQIKMVAFVQSDGDKFVQQAGADAPQALTSDIGTTMITGVPVYQCSTSFTPTVTIKNFGTTPLTSCTINYKVDAGTVMTAPWTGGPLATGATTTAVLPAITASAGAHTFTSFTSAPNGGADFDAANDQQVKPFAIVSAPGSAAPLVEGFTSTTFPPTGWFINNPDGDATWVRASGPGGFGTSTACSKIDFYSIPAGTIDEFYAKNVDFTGTTTAALTFNVAYAQYSASYVDDLAVLVSSDCGATWTSVYDKSGATLATNGGAFVTASAFSPTSTQWRNEACNLNAFAGQSNVMVKFVATSGYGNDAYIDDINLTNGSAGVNDIAELANNVTVYPNPISTSATVNFNLVESNPVTIEMVNAIGQVVSTTNLGTLNAGTQTYSVNASNLSNGLYFINIRVGNSKVVKKVSINK